MNWLYVVAVHSLVWRRLYYLARRRAGESGDVIVEVCCDRRAPDFEAPSHFS